MLYVIGKYSSVLSLYWGRQIASTQLLRRLRVVYPFMVTVQLLPCRNRIESTQPFLPTKQPEQPQAREIQARPYGRRPPAAASVSAPARKSNPVVAGASGSGAEGWGYGNGNL